MAKIASFETQPAALSEEREREFDEWVYRRLSEWSAAEMRAFDLWLLEESHFEFVAAVRRAWMRRRLEESGRTAGDRSR